ncbi:GNAT family N-acetyltransferase [Nocardioides astragali]|uniref:GNAT family N-acetyltransferase n=1 Tax=Nocardioides astragali TaxID=1776736 RepID=A0ABW2NC04_9ACTN|nr:GNAT family N-acetyltransferase [Nocardioides astragali]
MSTLEPPRLVPEVAGADPELDQHLSDRLSEFNRAATPDVTPAEELTIRVRDETDELVGGISGWTWGGASGMGMVWVHPAFRGSGLGSELLRAFETEAARRGCTHVFVTSFTFQAPGFYERHGYRQIFRWEGVPTPEHADVHFRKDLLP